MDTTLTETARRAPHVTPDTPDTPATVGTLLREWRQRRRLSQLDLACMADVSTRHLSFVESGRSVPSRDMLIRLAERLDVPLRERNALFLAAGYAPLYRERALADPKLEPARRAVELVLKGHEPYPALAVDRHWTMIAANAALQPLVASADASLLAPPVNVLRLSMHPHGLANVIENWHEWRAHLLARLRRQIDVSGDATLAALLEELEGYPAPSHAGDARRGERDPVVVPLRLRTELGVLSFFSTTTVFGTPVDITLSELAIEAFFPADDATARILHQVHGGVADSGDAEPAAAARINDEERSGAHGLARFGPVRSRQLLSNQRRRQP